MKPWWRRTRWWSGPRLTLRWVFDGTRSATRTERQRYTSRELLHPTLLIALWVPGQWISQVTLPSDSLLPAPAFIRLFVTRAECLLMRWVRWRAKSALWKEQDRRLVRLDGATT